MDKFAPEERIIPNPGGVIWVKAIAEDGTFGLGRTDSGHATQPIIAECLAPLVVGQEVGAIDRCNDRMWRGTLSFGNEGLTARAVAGVDLALWDLWGKTLDQPVYRLAGGPQRTEMEVYATGNDVDWYLELGFKKFKLARPHGPVDGQAGIDGTVELMAKCRELIGPDADLMLDCWMTFDLDFAVRICEALKPYRMRWMEEMLMPHDWEGHRALRQRVPWQTLADGEHWSTRHPGMRAVQERLVDLIQADIYWIGGFTEAMKLAHYADSQGVQMCLHTGGNDPYGQHWTAAIWDAFKVGAAALQSSTGDQRATKRPTRATQRPRLWDRHSRGLAKGGLVMKINQIEEFVTAVPHIPAIEKSRPGHYLEQPISLIKVHTDEGICGVGEGGRGGSLASLEAEWIGVDPMQVNLGDKGGAMIMALYDIAGKALGVPAWKLMGSKHWDKVPVGWWSPPLEPREFAAMAEEGAKRGFKTHKLKARPWNIVETVKLMTKATGPDYGIIVDPNFTFGDLSTSLRLAESLEPYNIEAFEDPFQYLPGWHQYRDFRRHTRIRLAPHLGDPQMVLSAIRAEAADCFNLGGNVESAQICAGMAAAAGMPVWLQVVGLGLGVSGAYGTHVHATIPNATIPSDSLHFTRENDLIGGALTPVDGFVAVPDAPGLGVELDMEAVEKYRVG